MARCFFTIAVSLVFLCVVVLSRGKNPRFQGSCYLISDAESGGTWSANRATCQGKSGDLVSLETEAEWDFLNDELQKRCIGQPNEWHIGLQKVGDKWQWVNGSPLTISKWQTTAGKPDDEGGKVVMSKDYPPTKQGLLSNLENRLKRAYICEIPEGEKECTEAASDKPRAPAATEDSFIVTLEVFSGVPDPQWTIHSDDSKFDEVGRLYRAAKKYKPEEAPAKLGYEGFSVQEIKKGKKKPLTLIVGPETKQLQLLLLRTSPANKVPEPLNNIVEEEINSGNVRAVKRNRMKRYAPWFRPARWNSPFHVIRNNCYNYASTRRTNTFAQPGHGSGEPYPYQFTAEDMRRAAESDGCVFVEAKKHMCAPQGDDDHLAALFVSTAPGLEDYHWYRLDNNGYWTHKPGRTPATDVDAKGNKIRDPRKAANGRYPYEFVCFMTINRKTLKIC